MASIKNLRDKKVIVKLAGLTRAISASVVSEEKEFLGLWFSGGPLTGEMVSAGIPKDVESASPVFFVPLSQIQWLVAAKE